MSIERPITIIKIGTNILNTEYEGVNLNRIRHLVIQMVKIHKSKTTSLILVTSGAIACGAQAMGITPVTVDQKQAAAAVGQIILMRDYAQFFNRRGVGIGQLLLTKECITNPVQKRNVKNTLYNLLKNEIIPIINENDSVATDEIGEKFGDNDELSAHVARLIKANRLIYLTDIDGLYTANPKLDPNAQFIHRLDKIDTETLALVQDEKNGRSRGGMTSKLTYAKLASESGVEVVLANGTKVNIIKDVMANKKIGTWVSAQKKKGKANEQV